MEISLKDLSKNNFKEKNIRNYKTTERKSSDFSKFLRETKNNIQGNKQSQSLNCKKVRESTKEKDINSIDNKTKLNNIKSELKKAGIDSKKIENASSLDEVKEAVSQVLKDNKVLEKLRTQDCEDDTSSLLILLLLQGNLSFEDLKNIVQSENGEDVINKVKNSIVEKVILNDLPLDANKNITKQDVLKALPNIIKDLSEILNPNEKVNLKDNKLLNVVSELKQKIESIFNENNTIKNTDDLLSKIKSEISTLINQNKTESLVNDEKSINNSTNNIILQNKEYMNTSKVSNKTLDNSNEESNLLNNSQSNSEEDFLENLTSNKSDDKISKVTNFMNQFNKISTDNLAKLESNLVVNKVSFNNDIIKAVKFMQLNDMKELTVKIMPKELGELVINLTVEQGVMKANISATNKEAYNILNSNLEEITSKLQENNIKIHNFTVDIYNQDTTFFKDGSQNRNNNENFKGEKSKVNTIEIEEENTENISNNENNLNMLA